MTTKEDLVLVDNQNRYGWISIALHWICALIIFGLFGLGIYMTGLDYYSPWYHRGPALHIAMGILIFSLMLWRLIWRIKSTSPAPVPGQSAAAVNAAKLIKFALYALVFLVCISGYLVTTAEGKGASFFDWFSIPAITELSPEVADAAEEIHEIVAWTIMILVALHAGAALLHHFVFRDKTLTRMLTPNQK